MATVDEIARSALGAIGSVEMAGLVQAHTWVSNRYAEIAASSRLRSLRRAGSATIAAPDTTGTVTIARGATSAVGTGTTWTTDLRGRFLKLRTTWYEIADVPDATHLTLATAFGEDDVTDGAPTIVQRYVILPSEVRFAGSWIIDRLWVRLEEVSYRALCEQLAPGHFYSQTLPAGGGFVAHVGFDAAKGGQVYEIWPYARQSETVHFVYWTKPPRLEADEEIPSTIDDFILKEGVLIDVYRFAMGQALTNGRTDVAAFWRNEMRAQMTSWDEQKRQAVKADRGADDTEWLFTLIGAPGSLYGDVRTAREHVWAVGNRP